MKCQACSQETLLPFRCPYCGGQFCSAHRLPENHVCPGIAQARSQRQEQVMTSQAYNSYNYSYLFGQEPFRRKQRIRFSKKELKHIGIAALLVVGIGFSIGFYGNMAGAFRPTWDWAMMATFAVFMTVSFLVHEIGHKIMAQKNGLWAEFRLTMWGSVLTFLSVFLPFKMIAPGAMMIGGSTPSKRDILKISVAGPITNIVFAALFVVLAFALSTNLYGYVFVFSAYINAFMALFNLIPFGVLDGYKIFSVDRTIWALMFIPSIALTIFTYFMI